MRTILMIAVLLLWLAQGVTFPQVPPAAEGTPKPVLILLRPPQGALAKRLADAPPSSQVPQEVRDAAQREQSALVDQQQDEFERRIKAVGATGVIRYTALDMLRAELPESAMTSVQSDPAVVSVTPLSEEPPAGGAIGLTVRKPDPIQSPSLIPNVPPPGPMNPGIFQGGAPPMQLPMQGMMPNPMPGMMPNPGTQGGMFQSVLGMTGQLGMQAGMAMPRMAPAASLLAAGTQVAQMILTSRKQACSITLGAAATPIPQAGGQGVIAVNAPPSCLWQANSDADWLQINTDGPMIGPGIVRYTATAAGSGVLRSGVVTIAGSANIKVKGQTSITVRQGR
jgi:hypothetical protein